MVRSATAKLLGSLVGFIGTTVPAAVLLTSCQTGNAANRDANSDAPAARVDGARLTVGPDSPALASVVVAPVGDSRAANSLRLNGRLVWDENVTVRVFTPIAGRVAQVLVDAGQRVHAGQALALISAPEFGQAQADARRAAADLTLAVRTLGRQRDLAAHGVAPRKDVEAAEADSARAFAEKLRADTRLALYGGDSNSQSQAFQLRTPLDGQVVERNISPGQEVRPDQMLANAPQLVAPLFVVTDPARLWVLLDVADRDLPQLAVGQLLTVHVQAWPDRPFRGRLSVVGSTIDPSTRTVKVRGLVENPGFHLKAEMLVAVDVAVADAPRLVVPSHAVLLDGNDQVVFIEESRGIYRRSVVTLGPERDGQVPVIAGLQKGDRVVVEGTLFLAQLFRGLTPITPRGSGTGRDPT